MDNNKHEDQVKLQSKAYNITSHSRLLYFAEVSNEVEENLGAATLELGRKVSSMELMPDSFLWMRAWCNGNATPRSPQLDWKT